MEEAPGVVSTVSLLEVPTSDGLAFFQNKPEFSVAEVGYFPLRLILFIARR